MQSAIYAFYANLILFYEKLHTFKKNVFLCLFEDVSLHLNKILGKLNSSPLNCMGFSAFYCKTFIYLLTWYFENIYLI